MNYKYYWTKYKKNKMRQYFVKQKIIIINLTKKNKNRQEYRDLYNIYV